MSGDFDDEYAVIHGLETQLQVANREILSLKAQLADAQSRLMVKEP